MHVVSIILLHLKYNHNCRNLSIHVGIDYCVNILVCPSGSYLNPNNNDRCEICPVNTYNPDTNSATCTECQTGRDTQQQTGQTSVDSCGKYWNNVYMENKVTTRTFDVICETPISVTIKFFHNSSLIR